MKNKSLDFIKKKLQLKKKWQLAQAALFFIKVEKDFFLIKSKEFIFHKV